MSLSGIDDIISNIKRQIDIEVHLLDATDDCCICITTIIVRVIKEKLKRKAIEQIKKFRKQKETIIVNARQPNRNDFFGQMFAIMELKGKIEAMMDFFGLTVEDAMG